ncbi:hypothetical protein J6590_001583 [Homalodisca vitripennis]|nr:hypothetical protein J6590_001583 [Homalodisca vitripennis]
MGTRYKSRCTKGIGCGKQIAPCSLPCVTGLGGYVRHIMHAAVQTCEQGCRVLESTPGWSTHLLPPYHGTALEYTTVHTRGSCIRAGLHSLEPGDVEPLDLLWGFREVNSHFIEKFGLENTTSRALHHVIVLNKMSMKLIFERRVHWWIFSYEPNRGYDKLASPDIGFHARYIIRFLLTGPQATILFD